MIRSSLKKGTDIDENQARECFDKIKAMPECEYGIFRPLRGAEVTCKDPLVLGPFTIYDLTRHLCLLKTKYPYSPYVEDEFNNIMQKEDIRIFIGTKFITRDDARAEELADESFVSFENTIAYMWPYRTEDFDIAIFNHRGLKHLPVLLLSSKGTAVASRLKGSIRTYGIGGGCFCNSHYGYDCVWTMHNQKRATKLNEIQNKILLAIDWIGKGTRETDETKAFIQFIFAIEALLGGKEKIISSSIVSLLAEGAAFILGKDYASRVSIEKEVKTLYVRRSNTLHGGETDISHKEADRARYIARELIIKMTTVAELKSLKSSDELRDYIKQRKYS
jgi:hypothetical protein